MSTLKNAHDAEVSHAAMPAERAQLLKDADTLLVVVLEHITPDDKDRIARQHPLLWSIRQELLESTDREVQRFTAALGLSMIAQHPDILQGALLTLRDRLTEGLPLNWAIGLDLADAVDAMKAGSTPQEGAS